MNDYFTDEFLYNTLRSIGVQIKMYEFINEANQAGLEYDKYFEDLELKKIKLNQEIEKVVKHIKNTY
jgi:hypothetical protein